MSEIGGLNEWIDSRHLTTQAFLAYAEILAHHPARVVVIRDFLLESVARSLSRFLLAEALYHAAFGLYSRMDDVNVTAEEWLSAKPEDHFYRYKVFAGVRPEFQLSPNTITFLKFTKALHSDKFRELFTAVYARPLGRLVHNIHRFEHGDFLAKHTDDAKDRRLAFVLYLSSAWDASDGGILHLVDGYKEIKVEPEYNSLVLFDVTKGLDHYVSPIVAENARLAIGGWAFRPSDADGTP